MAEEGELRDSEAVDKVRETGSIGMIISGILCLFAYIACPLFLLTLEMWSHPYIDYAVTSIGVTLHIITTNLDSGYWKVKFSEASWNKLNFGGQEETHLDKDVNEISQCITGLQGNDVSPAAFVAGRSGTLERPGLWIGYDHG